MSRLPPTKLPSPTVTGLVYRWIVIDVDVKICLGVSVSRAGGRAGRAGRKVRRVTAEGAARPPGQAPLRATVSGKHR